MTSGTGFLQWCAAHAPGVIDEDNVVELHGHLCVVSLEQKKFLENTTRPAYFAGTPVASGNFRSWRLLPGAVRLLGESMQQVQLNAHSAWLVTCGKDVLFEGVTSEVPEEGTIIALTHRSWIVGIGIVLRQSGEPDQPAVRVLCHIGSFLKK